mgnify:CR=1 FL=1
MSVGNPKVAYIIDIRDDSGTTPRLDTALTPTVEFLAGCEAFLFRHGCRSFMWVYEPYRDFEERVRPFGNLWKTSPESEKKMTCGNGCFSMEFYFCEFKKISKI